MLKVKTHCFGWIFALVLVASLVLAGGVSASPSAPATDPTITVSCAQDPVLVNTETCTATISTLDSPWGPTIFIVPGADVAKSGCTGSCTFRGVRVVTSETATMHVLVTNSDTQSRIISTLTQYEKMAIASV